MHTFSCGLQPPVASRGQFRAKVSPSRVRRRRPPRTHCQWAPSPTRIVRAHLRSQLDTHWMRARRGIGAYGRCDGSELFGEVGLHQASRLDCLLGSPGLPRTRRGGPGT